jgi:hypothetical protein
MARNRDNYGYNRSNNDFDTNRRNQYSQLHQDDERPFQGDREPDRDRGYWEPRERDEEYRVRNHDWDQDSGRGRDQSNRSGNYVSQDQGLYRVHDWNQDRDFGRNQSNYGRGENRFNERNMDDWRSQTPRGVNRSPNRLGGMSYQNYSDPSNTGSMSGFGNEGYGSMGGLGNRSLINQDRSFGNSVNHDSSSSTQNRNRGPKGYQRSDERLQEEVSDRLMHQNIDCSEVEIKVQNGEVTLTGTIQNKQDKRMIEDIAESIMGVKEVNNQLKVSRGAQSENKESTTSATTNTSPTKNTPTSSTRSRNNAE